MFGWLRRITKRTTVDEAQQLPAATSPEHEPVPTQPDAPEVAQRTAAAEVSLPAAQDDYVEVYTPDPLPEPPTVWPPDHNDVAYEPGISDDVELGDDFGDEPDLVTEQHAVIAERPAPPTVTTSVVPDVDATRDVPAEVELATAESAETDAEGDVEPQFDGLLAAPSPRPAMPLSAHPNFAGLGLATWEPTTPRLLQPEAALSPEAQAELLRLFDDLFGPCGRYRLEWRGTRTPGDDSMFAEIMTADLVRRVQNTIADVAELERPAPPKAIEAARNDDDGESDARFRQAS